MPSGCAAVGDDIEHGVGDGGSVLAAVAAAGGGASVDEASGGAAVGEYVGDGLGLWPPLATELVGVAPTGLVAT